MGFSRRYSGDEVGHIASRVEGKGRFASAIDACAWQKGRAEAELGGFFQAR
jgi:hypothetical protein